VLPQITYLGLVDILTEWTPRKRLENLVNGRMQRGKGGSGRDISCQPPRVYGARMLRFLAGAITAEAPPDADPLLALEGSHPAAIKELAEEKERSRSDGASMGASGRGTTGASTAGTAMRTGGTGGKSKPPEEVRI